MGGGAGGYALEHDTASSKGSEPLEALALCHLSWDLGSGHGQRRTLILHP